MKIDQILENIDYLDVYNQIDVDVDYFLNDSRITSPNSLYFGITGERFNGSVFYKDALINGSVCAIVNDIKLSEDEINYLKENSKCVILVKNSVEALRQLAVYKRSVNDIPLVAITGSAGKTSTKDLIHAALNEKFSVYKTLGNKNNEIGLPLTLLNLKDEQIIILEMGMNHKGEISYLTNIAKPDVVIINNVGTAHIGNLGSRENILKAKLEILEGLNPGGVVIVNNDDDLLCSWANKNKGKYKIFKYGLTNYSDVQISDLKLMALSSTFKYDNCDFCVPIPGVQYVSNTLAALLVARVFNEDTELVSNGIKNFVLSTNRMDIQNKNGITVINDTYNANYDAVLYALKNLSNFDGRRIAVLGDMLELGNYSKSLHENLGKEVCNIDIDLLITVGMESKHTYLSAIYYGMNAVHFDSNNDAIKYILANKKPGDVYLIKASQGCKFIEIVDELLK